MVKMSFLINEFNKKYNKSIFTSELKYLFNILIKNGDEARLVGGCVRNFLLGKTINDYDIATKYLPEELENILKKNNIKYFTTGKQIGTITAIINNQYFEITTLRKDIKTDGRHAIVKFTNNYLEDAKRRDFTFNALYMDYSGKIYDYFNGISDLKNGIINFIGNSQDRIIEDNLRILRFFRFYAYYCCEMNYFDLQNCIKYKDKIKTLSKERISEEFYKILQSPYSVKVLHMMQHCGILQEILNINTKLNLDNLQIFYSVNKFINFGYDYLFVLCLILSKNQFDFNLLLTNKNKKYIKTILNNLPNKIDEFEIKKLLFYLQDKKIVEDVIVLYFCNNFVNFGIVKNTLDFIKKTDIPILNIFGKDLIEFGFENKRDFSKIISLAKEVFVESGFVLSKNKILKIVENNKNSN